MVSYLPDLASPREAAHRDTMNTFDRAALGIADPSLLAAHDRRHQFGDAQSQALAHSAIELAALALADLIEATNLLRDYARVYPRNSGRTLRFLRGLSDRRCSCDGPPMQPCGSKCKYPYADGSRPPRRAASNSEPVTRGTTEGGRRTALFDPGRPAHTATGLCLGCSKKPPGPGPW